jgi:hypothetical protein
VPFTVPCSFFVVAVSSFSRLFFLFYTDPGSGAMLWQLVAAFFVGAMFYVTFAYRKIKLFTSKMFGLANTQVTTTEKSFSNKRRVTEN